MIVYRNTETRFDSDSLELENRLKKKFPGIDVSIGGTVYLRLHRVIVPRENRNEGMGTQVMNEIIKYADSKRKTVALTPSGDFGSSVTRLKSFYKKFGFVENKGRMADYSISESMYRLPE